MEIRELSDKALEYCERVGVYEVWREKGDILTYYSYFGSEGFYKVEKNLMSGEEKRTHLKSKPKAIGYRYNYFVG